MHEHSILLIQKTEATVNGVLGGFEKLNKPDIVDSKKFLALLNSKYGLKYGRATDCGAGVGRITKELLLGFFKTVIFLKDYYKSENITKIRISLSKKYYLLINK